MKIMRLELRAFGPFTGAVLDLAAGQHGLHLVFGPNEAGKSSALRAIEYALFGFPQQMGDDFLHAYQNLRVGATLARGDGESFCFLRRKGRGNSLLADDNATPLADEVLQPFLAGLDRERFRTMFGIDHLQLVHGGRELAHGGGGVGEALFAAASGIADLQAIQRRLQAEADELFKPRASTKTVNRCLKALDDARRRAKQSALNSDEWQRRRGALDDAQRQRQANEPQLQQLRQAHERLERLRRAMPLAAQRAALRQQRDELGPTPRLPADFAARRREAAAALAAALQESRSLTEQLEGLDRDLAALKVPQQVLDAAEQLQPLAGRLGSHSKAQDDLPAVRAEHDAMRREAQRLLAELRPELALEQADTLRPTKLRELPIRELAAQHEALRVRKQQADEAATQLDRQVADDQAEADQLAAAGADVSVLREALRRAQGEGDLEAARAEAARRLAALEDRAAADLARLLRWSGTLEALRRLPVPAAEAVEPCERQWAELDRDEQRLAELREQNAAQQADEQRQLDQATLAGDVPSEEALAAARQQRDQAWARLLAAWQAAEAGEAAGLSAQYPAAVQAADELADRLRREAQRVAEIAGIHARLRQLRRAAETLQLQRDEAAARRRQAEEHWQTLWQPSGVLPGDPREMRAWLEAQRALRRQAEAIAEQQQAVHEIEGRIGARRGQLVECLRQCGQPADEAATLLAAVASGATAGLPAVPQGARADKSPAVPCPALPDSSAKCGQPGDETTTLLAAVARAQAAVERADAEAARREELQRSLRQSRSRLQEARKKSDAAATGLCDWAEQWTAAIGPLGLPAGATPATANAALAQLAEVCQRIEAARELARRIDGMVRDAMQFQRDVAALAERLAPDLGGQPCERAAEELIRQFDQARVEGEQRKTLQTQRAALARRAADACRRREELTHQLRQMCLEAGCQDVDGLPAIEQRAADAARLDARLGQLEEQLCELAVGAGLDALLAETEATDADALPGELDRLAGQIAELQQAQSQLAEQIGREKEALEAMQRDAGAVDAAEEVQDLLARLHGDCRQYARLRLAAAILRDGIETYRAKNEDPVLRRAGELFGRLTLGRFDRLLVETDEQGHGMLKGVRADGPAAVAGEPKTLDLAAMSEGTADQLFLALRLASIEHSLEGREPAPLVFDDILISFDDARAAAALEALADLSRRTQVLLFTHHAHLVELARRQLPPDVLFVHQLP